MPDEPHELDEAVSFLISGHLKMSSIVSSLLFACRTSNMNNQQINDELDATSKQIDDYFEEIEKAIEAFRDRSTKVARI